MGMIQLSGGMLRLGAVCQNNDNSTGATCIDYKGGSLVLHGASLATANSNNPCILTVNSVLNVRVYGCVENNNSTNARPRITEFVVTADTDPVYSIDVNGTVYSYTPSPGDSVSVIAAGLAAAIVSGAVVQPVPASGATGTLTAATAGVNFSVTVIAGSITLSDVQLNNSGLNNLIGGTVIVVDADVI
jgi:phage tail sheath gpL-like